MYHEVVTDPQRERVIEDVLGFLSRRGLVERLEP
jgi:hypothetical protein